MHNALKGIRTLSPAALDRLMQALDVTIPQLLWTGGGQDPSAVRAIPLLRQRIGPGSLASFTVFKGYVPFIAAQVASLTQPVAANLGADLALPAEYRAGDLALLDQNPTLRIIPEPSSCWIVAVSAGLRVRYVRRIRGGLEFAADPNPAAAQEWQSISLQGRSILEIVRARIVWIGREMETRIAGPDEPAGRRD